MLEKLFGLSKAGTTVKTEVMAGLATFLTMAYITCLLYTSPSPRDATLSRMPSSA